jgi:hypothetical protein
MGPQFEWLSRSSALPSCPLARKDAYMPGGAYLGIIMNNLNIIIIIS